MLTKAIATKNNFLRLQFECFVAGIGNNIILCGQSQAQKHTGNQHQHDLLANAAASGECTVSTVSTVNVFQTERIVNEHSPVPLFFFPFLGNSEA